MSGYCFSSGTRLEWTLVRCRLLRGVLVLGLFLLARVPAAGEELSLTVSNSIGQVVLSWPGWATDGVLERSTNVGPYVSWLPVSPTLYTSDSAGWHYALSSPPEQTGYFRLHRLGPRPPGLVAYWNLDEMGSPTLTDAGGGNLLEVTNASWAPGRVGSGCLRFNGLGLDAGGSLAWVSNANYQVLPPAGMPFSVSLWFSLEAPIPPWQPLMGTDIGGADGWHVGIDSPAPGTNYVVWRGTGTNSSLNLDGQSLLLPGRWHQLHLSYSSNQAAIYVDSQLIAQGGGSLFNSQALLFFGAGGPDRTTFLGRIDELRIYTNALTQEEVSVTGEWHFDENTGALASDSSILGHPAAVVSPMMWATGKTNSGIDLTAGQITSPNEDYSVLPPGGAPFSLSLWMLPRALAAGRSGLMYCADATGCGWQMTVDLEALQQPCLEVTSTNLGGTLALRAPVDLTNNVWTKLDLTYDGGQASVFVNGRKVQTDLGAIRSTPGPLILGAVPGTASFNGVVDELKTYSRKREESEIGPVALPLWQMAMTNSTTELLLQGSGPPGKLLSYSILSAPTLGTLNYSSGLPIVSFKAGGQKGPDLFVYAVSDGEFISPPATAAVSVVEPHWLSPIGGSSPPLDGTSLQRAWAAGSAGALDAIWRTNNYYDCFFYGPGEYQTTGWRYPDRATANPGCKHIGSGAEGPDGTTLKLVNNWETWNEGLIFAPSPQSDSTDFEVRNMVLDCNAEGNPKYTVGEPVWLRIPLTSTARVESVTLHWNGTNIPGSAFTLGRAAAFNISTRTAGLSGYTTNTLAVTSTGQVDVVSLGTNTDQILLQLTRRGDGVDFYSLAEMDIAGGTVSLPQAVVVGGGTSQLDAEHSILQAFDGDATTQWASGPESQVQITLPLESGTPVSQVNFNWNCQTLSNLSRLGPAASYVIYARDESTGQNWQVPFVSQGRASNGLEIVSFGTSDSTNSIVTDQLTILLTSREQGVTYYSLKELGLQSGPFPTQLKIPTATSTLVWDTTHSVLKAFDGDLAADWACGTQGSVTAIELHGSNITLDGLKVVNFGTKAARECFPVGVWAPDYGPPLRNVLIEDCTVTQPATNNHDGLTAFVLVGQGAGRLLNSAIRRCTVSGVEPYFGYSHAFGAASVENCRTENCEFGVYFEPYSEGYESVGPVMIRSNVFVNVVLGISVDFHPGAHFDTLICEGNEIVLDNTASTQPFGIRFCDTCAPGPSGTITNLLVLNNIIRYPDWAPHPSSIAGGLMYSDIKHAVYGNNIVALGNTQSLRVRAYPSGIIPGKPAVEDCDNPGLFQPGPSTYPASVDALLPGYRRAWFNNRDLPGTLLPVRFWQWGVDGLASQQQWPG